MKIQIDTREHKSELFRIQSQFDSLGVEWFMKKLDVGDYMDHDRPIRSVDRKQSLLELCSNITQQHDRFRRELLRAIDSGIEPVILVEHGGGIKHLEDVWFWENPRLGTSPKATTGQQLYKSMITMASEYGVRFEFCNKRQTGRRIMEILSE